MLTYWETATHFMDVCPLPRFRAYLGATSAMLGPAPAPGGIEQRFLAPLLPVSAETAALLHVPIDHSGLDGAVGAGVDVAVDAYFGWQLFRLVFAIPLQF